VQNPFKPSSPSGSADPRFPFGQPPMMPAVTNGAAVLDDPVIWTLFLKRLGNDDEQDAATITAFAKRLGIHRNRILAKLAAHYHDNRTLQ
jgi:hypothetical protein